MLRVDEGTNAAALLRLRDGVQRQRGLAGRFRPVDLDDATARQTADAERHVEAKRTCGDRGDLHHLAVTAQSHDGAFAESPLDLAERSIQRLRFVHPVPAALDDSKRTYHGIPHSTS